MPFAALAGGILILLMPRLLNYVVAIYLILVGVIGFKASIISSADGRARQRPRRWRRPAYRHEGIHRSLARWLVAVGRRAGDAADQNYHRKSSSLSVLRWAAMATALTFGFAERDSSNACSFDSSVRQTLKA